VLIPGPRPPSLAKHTARTRATAFAARSAASLPGRGSPGSVAAMVAGTRGTRSPPVGCVRDATASGPRRSAPHVTDGRHTRIGTARLSRARTSSRRVLAGQPRGAGPAVPFPALHHRRGAGPRDSRIGTATCRRQRSRSVRLGKSASTHRWDVQHAPGGRSAERVVRVFPQRSLVHASPSSQRVSALVSRCPHRNRFGARGKPARNSSQLHLRVMWDSKVLNSSTALHSIRHG
jgi:hypothetical protein